MKRILVLLLLLVAWQTGFANEDLRVADSC